MGFNIAMNKKRIIIIVSVILALAIVAGGIIYYLNSPVYALLQIRKDLEREGIDGLRSHFTDDAEEFYDGLMNASDKWVVRQLLRRVGIDGFVDTFRYHSEDMEWEFEDLLVGSSRADVYVSFNYDDDIKGTLELRLIKEDGQWKIDGFGIPELDELGLKSIF